MAAPPLSPLAAEVRRHDRDRFVTALFAPAAAREALIALYAFNLEVARTRESVSEPLLGEIRLQWWRDAVDKLYGGGELAHPVVAGLGSAIRAHDLSRGLFERIIDARALDLADRPPATLADLEAYVEGSSAALVSLALEVVGARGPEVEQLARDAGLGWGLLGVLRAVPFHARTARVYLPADLLAAHGLTPWDVTSGKAPPALAATAKVIADRAAHHLRAARARRHAVSRRARSPLLVVALAETYLKRLRGAAFDLHDARWSEARPPIPRLIWRSLAADY